MTSIGGVGRDRKIRIRSDIAEHVWQGEDVENGSLTLDEAADLEWYFGGAAEADCGVRSVQGGFEAAMDRLALGGRRLDGHEAWDNGVATWVEGQQPVRESRATASRFDIHVPTSGSASGKVYRKTPAPKTDDSNAVEERLKSQVEDHMGHRNSLRRMARIYARLGELDKAHRTTLELHFGDAIKIRGVSMSLLCTVSSVVEATDRVNERRRKRAEKEDRGPPEPLTPRDALLNMHHHVQTADNQAERDILDGLVAKALPVLRAAMDAYSKVRAQ